MAFSQFPALQGKQSWAAQSRPGQAQRPAPTRVELYPQFCPLCWPRLGAAHLVIHMAQEWD